MVSSFLKKSIVLGVLLSLLLLSFSESTFAQNSGRFRLLILADMGNEPDEMQQMVHMVMCSNEFDLEGLIAVTGKYLRPESSNPYKQKLHPELFHEIINAYAKVLPNLKKHATGWHSPNYLRSIVASGQPGYGIKDTGEGKSSPGSKLIIDIVGKNDPRPIWVVINAGSNTLAQALKDYQKTHSKAEVDAFVAKLRVFENGAQDNAGAWICHAFPNIHWIRSNYQTYCYGGPSGDGGADNKGQHTNLGPNTWQPYSYSNIGQHQWALEHIKGNHGPLGAVWPLRQFHSGGIGFLEGGGTIPWLGLLNKGMFDIDKPHWGSWSGRYTKEKHKNVWSKHSSVNKDEKKWSPFYAYKDASDNWTNPEDGTNYNNDFAPVWRWRRAFFNNIVCRMDWCKSSYKQANHHPIAAVNGDKSDAIIEITTTSGITIDFDASDSTDPDNDQIDFNWWVYHEAGTYPGKIKIPTATQKAIAFEIPDDAANSQIHLILEIKDKNKIASLYDYKRIVINVR